MNKNSILIVDDEKIVRKVLKNRISEKINVNVTSAATVNTAIEKLKYAHFDLILLDIFLNPLQKVADYSFDKDFFNIKLDDNNNHLAGLFFLKNIRNGKIGEVIGKSNVKDIPIIILSAMVDTYIINAIEHYENVIILDKSDNLENIIDQIQVMLNQ